MIEILLIFLVGIAIGVGGGFLLGKNYLKPLLLTSSQNEEYAKKDVERLQKELENARLEAIKFVAEVKREAKEEMLSRDNEMRSFSQDSLKNMEAKFNMLANQVLEKQTEKLQKDNDNHLDLVLNPLKENLNKLDHAIKDVSEKSIEHHTSFKEAIKRMEEQTKNIGKEADNLARALKSDSKMQGDWGEMILDHILEKSGLRKGFEYKVQENIKTEDNKNVRPDIIVEFPDKRSIIIDSKVSLTAFSEYINAEDEIVRNDALKRHVDSVRKHVNELANKSYSKDVKGSSEYVIMFMPSEAAYVAAVQADNNLNSYAWDQRIIIACPNIIIMTLQIVNNIWQSARQERNVEKIINAANGMYQEFVLFVNAFDKVGKDLKNLQDDYDIGWKRLVEGRGNLIQRFEGMKSLGLSPKKEMDSHILEEADV